MEERLKFWVKEVSFDRQHNVHTMARQMTCYTKGASEMMDAYIHSLFHSFIHTQWDDLQQFVAANVATMIRNITHSPIPGIETTAPSRLAPSQPSQHARLTGRPSFLMRLR